MAIFKSPRVAKICRYGLTEPLEAKVVKKRPDATILARSLAVAPVVVIVGECSGKFHIHQAFLCASSDFMKNALKPEWDSKKERTLTLPDASPIAFHVYSSWLYTGHIGMGNDPKEDDAEEDKSKASELEWDKWTLCYELGRFLQDIDFTDALIDYVTDKMRCDDEYSDHLINLVYSTTSQDSPYRKLVVDLSLNVWLPITTEALQKVGYTSEFLADLGAAFLVTKRSVRIGVYDFLHTSYNKDACLYHEHTVTKSPCYKASRGLS